MKKERITIWRMLWELVWFSSAMVLGAMLMLMYMKVKEEKEDVRQSAYVFEEAPDWAEDSTLHSAKKNYLEYLHNKSE
jgi:uncharacterized membrane protein